MRNTFNYALYCRASKADRTGMSPVELCVTMNGQRTFLNLPYKCLASDFNRKRRPKPIQDYCNAITGRISETITDMTRYGQPITATAIKEWMRNGGYKAYTVSDMLNEFLKVKKNDKDITQGAYRKYELVRDLFLKFHKGEEATTITTAVVTDFYNHLRNTYNVSTANSYIAKLKTMVKFGMDNGHLHINPFTSLKLKSETRVIDYLTNEELDKLMNTPIENESLNAVRSAFCLQCFSGLSYIDLEHLQKEDIQIDENGTHYISKRRVKTNIPYTAVILPEGVEILKRNNYRLKVISNQKMNLYLKQVMELTGLNHKLTTHLGRKTYAHILLNDKKVRVETVAKALGHFDPRTTLKHYAELSASSVVQEIEQSLK